MAYSARILADSISPDGIRLITFEVTFPRIVLAEFNTHRVFSRNSASSRAIPVKKSIEQVRRDPFIPEVFAQNQKGMQGDTPLEQEQERFARDQWLYALSNALKSAERLEQIGLHKALANRILEPFKWHTVIVTATEWSNFFALRCDENAQAEIRKPAQMMRDLYESHEPQTVSYGAWHLPLVTEEEIREGYPTFDSLDLDNWIRHWDYWKKVSVGRCARVSYLTHDGKRDPQKDVELHDRLMLNGHLSPFEHVATPIESLPGDEEIMLSGNFKGWHQYRKQIPNEHVWKVNDAEPVSTSNE